MCMYACTYMCICVYFYKEPSLELLYTGHGIPYRRHKLPNKKCTAGMGYLPLKWFFFFWSRVSKMSPTKEYRLLPLLLVAHWNLIITPYFWRYHISWSQDKEKSTWYLVEIFFLLASFHSTWWCCSAVNLMNCNSDQADKICPCVQ